MEPVSNKLSIIGVSIYYKEITLEKSYCFDLRIKYGKNYFLAEYYYLERIVSFNAETVPDAVWDDIAEIAKDEKFDTVVFLDQLAKSNNEVEILSRIKTLLSDQGRLILTVPLCPWLYGSVDKLVGRTKRYRKKDILNLLNQTGYKVIEYRSINSLAVPGLFVNSKLLKRSKLGKLQLKLYHTLVPLSAFLERILPFPRANAFIVAGPK